jgi:hypothetical protein
MYLGMSWFLDDVELSEEEVEEVILEAARRIKQYGMEMPAIMALESFKPLMFIGGELTRLTLSPFFPIFGSNIDLWGNKLINVFEEKKNVEKLIQLLEQMSRGEYDDGSGVDEASSEVDSGDEEET